MAVNKWVRLLWRYGFRNPCCQMWFIGMELNKQLKKNIDLTDEIQQFNDAVMRAADFQNVYCPGMAVSSLTLSDWLLSRFLFFFLCEKRLLKLIRGGSEEEVWKNCCFIWDERGIQGAPWGEEMSWVARSITFGTSHRSNSTCTNFDSKDFRCCRRMCVVRTCIFGCRGVSCREDELQPRRIE